MRRWSALIIVLVLLPAGSLHAFDVIGLQPLPPYGVFSTFSAESPARNTVGFGLGVEKSYDPGFWRFLLQFDYALHDRVELMLTAPYVSEWENRVDGFEDLAFGFKHRILDEGTYSPAVAYILTVSAPTGEDEFSTDGNVGGGLLLTKKIGPFKGHINALYSKPDKTDLNDFYSLNIGAELAVSNKSKILAELIGRKDYTENKLNLLEWRIGYRIATTENIFTTFGAGFDIKDRTPDYRFFFSLSLILPFKKTEVKTIYEE